MRNKNTPQLWDNLLFKNNEHLLNSGIYNDKINKVFEFIKGKSGRFLDLGIGMGNLEKKMLDSKLNFIIYGIDISSKSIDFLKKNLKGVFLVSKVEDIKFDPCSFDVVVMLDVLEHLDERVAKKVLRKVFKLIKFGGNLIISVPLNENLSRLVKKGENYNEHIIEYTVSKLLKKAKSFGFATVKYDLLYAFRKFYKIKSLMSKIFPKFRKPNLVVAYFVKE